MLYDANIQYEKKTISFKAPKKYFSGDFNLPDFLRHTRIFKDNNHSIEEVANDLGISSEEYEGMENGTIPITKEALTKFLKLYHLPKKVTRLIDQSEHKELAGRLYQLRIKNGNKTQEETAELLNISRTAYAGYESGRTEPDLKTLVKIAELYDTSLDRIAGRY